MKKVLVTDNYSIRSLSYLRSKSSVLVESSKSFKPTYKELEEVQALLVRSRTLVDQELLEQAPDLKVVISATSGTDHIDFKACEKRNIKVLNTVEANAQSAAELSFLLMLSLFKRTNQVAEVIDKKKWKSEVSRGLELYGKSLGLIGFGRVGSRVSRMAQAFGMKVSAYDPYKKNEDLKKQNVEPMGLSELLRYADIVSLHVPLTAETHGMLNKNNMCIMSEHSYLINASRGRVVDENDLMDFLERGQIAGAGLDVFRTEPLPVESRLRGLNNVVLTPHIGAYTEEAFERASMEAVELLINLNK